MAKIKIPVTNITPTISVVELKKRELKLAKNLQPKK